MEYDFNWGIDPRDWALPLAVRVNPTCGYAVIVVGCAWAQLTWLPKHWRGLRQ